jgi:hypothetical protein
MAQVTVSAAAARNPALVAAAESGDVTAAEAALNAGADINARDANGRTALMIAAFGGKTDLIRFLISRHADVNLKDAQGRTAISIVLQNQPMPGSLPAPEPTAAARVTGAAQALVGAAAEVRSGMAEASRVHSRITATAIRKSGHVAANGAGSVIDRGIGMVFGAHAGRVAGSVTRSVVRGATNLTADTAAVVQSGKVQKVVTSGYAAAERTAENLAQRAASANDMDIPNVDKVQRSAGVDAASLLSTLRAAMRTPNALTLMGQGQQALASGNALDFKSAAAWAPMIVSVAKSDPKLLISLLTGIAGTGLDQQQNILVLIAAAVKSDASLADAFFDRSRDPKAGDHVQELVQAAFADNFSLIRNLILSGEGNPFSAIAFEGLRTATGILFPVLPGQLAARTAMAPEDASRVIDIVSMLLDAGGDPNTRDSQGMTALMWAAKAGSVAATKLLLAHGADRSLLDAGGLSALQHALSSGTQELASLLHP